MRLNEKWMLFLIATIVVLFGVTNNLMKKTEAKTSTTVEEQRRAILETAHAYYRQGVQLQYDSYKKNLYSTPEDATSQHYAYTVCSGFTFQVYYQTLGIIIPDTTEELLDYSEDNKDNTDTVIYFYSGSDLIYSDEVLGTADDASYTNLADKWVDVLQPGDVIVVTGHAMLVDSIDYENRKITVIESGAGKRYSYINHADNYDPKGTIQYRDLNTKLKTYYNRIKNNGTLIERIAVIRFITDGESYINTDNEKATYSMTDAALSRLNYSNIDIDKIVKITEEDNIISQNVLTNIGEYITYELTIKNNGSENYSSFNVVENIDSNVIVTDYGNGELENNQLHWNVKSLATGDSVTLSYTVMVKNDKDLLGKIIISTGYVDNIATSRIETLIGNKLTKDEKNKIYMAYDNLKDNDQIEREFINQIYLDALDLNIGLTGLSNLDIISYDTSVKTGGKDILSVKSTKVNDTTVKKYIYNNYYGLRIGETNDIENSVVRAILQWNIYSVYETNDRARTLTSDMLIDGDIILVYTGNTATTDENLVDKAYIYLNNKLVRKVSSGEIEELVDEELTVFLRNIIGDNYIILRPSIAMGREYVEDIEYVLDFDSSLNIDKENKYIKYLKDKTTVKELIDMIQITGGNALVYDIDNKVKSNNNVLASGDVLTIYSNDIVKDKYIISILGDTNGDGIVDLIDLVQMRKQIVGWININTNEVFNKTGVYYHSLDFNKDGIIDLVDLVRMRKTIVGLM